MTTLPILCAGPDSLTAAVVALMVGNIAQTLVALGFCPLSQSDAEAKRGKLRNVLLDDVLVEQLLNDAAIQTADTLMLTIPSQLGVEFNLRVVESFAKHVAPALGWKPNTEA